MEFSEIFRRTATTLFARHAEPWNWLAHVLAALLFALGLWQHGAPLLALAALLFAGGFLPLPLPPLRATGLRFLAPAVEMAVHKERVWLFAPLTTRRALRIAGSILLAAAAVWALWVHELAVLTLLACLLSLLRVRAENRDAGIKP